MKFSKTLVVPLAGLLLVGVAGAALATSAPAGDTGAVIPAAETAPPAPPAGTFVKPPKDDAITDVLTDLVTKGTITAAQKIAILDALKVERTERQAARQAAREALKADREKLKGFFADGVITKAELDQLSAANPLRQLTTLMDDGKITLDELRSVGKGFMKGFGGGRGGEGGHRGWMWGGNVPAPTASPTTGG